MTQRLLFPPQIPNSLGHFWLGLHAEPWQPNARACQSCHGETSFTRGDCGPIYRLDEGFRICWRCLFEMWSERQIGNAVDASIAQALCMAVLA